MPRSHNSVLRQLGGERQLAGPARDCRFKTYEVHFHSVQENPALGANFSKDLYNREYNNML